MEAKQNQTQNKGQKTIHKKNPVSPAKAQSLQLWVWVRGRQFHLINAVPAPFIREMGTASCFLPLFKKKSLMNAVPGRLLLWPNLIFIYVKSITAHFQECDIISAVRVGVSNSFERLTENLF